MGRPRTGIGQLIGVRLQPEQIDALDAWIRHQDPQPTRPEAMRRILGSFMQQWHRPTSSQSGPLPPFEIGDRVRSRHFGAGTVVGPIVAMAGADPHAPDGIRDAGWRVAVRWDAAEWGVTNIADQALSATVDD